MPPANPQPTTLRALAILPARIASTRLPGKVLLEETGLPLFVHTAQAVARCRAIQRVIVATDGEEVHKRGTQAGVEVVMTSADHVSGTDRVHEALGGLSETYDVVLNVQADEPDVEPEDLERLVAVFEDPQVTAATLAVPITATEDLDSTSVVKVTRDGSGRALYFSRAPIPSRSHKRPGAPSSPLGLRHVGVYAYRPDALALFCSLPPSELETVESLEQLRWLEAGQSMTVVDARHAPRGIDTQEDYQAFVARCRSSSGAASAGTDSPSLRTP